MKEEEQAWAEPEDWTREAAGGERCSKEGGAVASVGAEHGGVGGFIVCLARLDNMFVTKGQIRLNCFSVCLDSSIAAKSNSNRVCHTPPPTHSTSPEPFHLPSSFSFCSCRQCEKYLCGINKAAAPIARQYNTPRHVCASVCVWCMCVSVTS